MHNTQNKYQNEMRHKAHPLFIVTYCVGSVYSSSAPLVFGVICVAHSLVLYVMFCLFAVFFFFLKSRCQLFSSVLVYFASLLLKGISEHKFLNNYTFFH